MKQNTKNRVIVLLLTALCIAMLLCTVTLNDNALSNSAFATDETVAADENLTFNLFNDSTEYRVTVKNRQITEVVIPETYNGLPVTEIADYGFANCTNLTVIRLPQSIIRIGKSSFSNCKNLEKIIGMSHVQVIDNNAFAMCSKLNNVALPRSIKTLGSTVFRSNTNTIYSRLTEEEMNALNANWNKGAESAEFIYGNTLKLTEILDDDNELIGYSISESQNLDEPNDYILGDTYSGVPILQIDEYAFCGCTFNTFTMMHGDIETLQNSDGSNDLIEAYGDEECKHTVNIKSNAFEDVDAKSIDFLVDITFIDKDVSYCDYEFENGFSYGVFAFSQIESITLPNSISIIPINAFYACDKLISIVNKDSSLSENHLSDRITTIGSNAFDGCTALENLYMPHIYNMGNAVFTGWGSLDTVEQTVHFEDHFYTPPIGKEGYDWDADWTGGLDDNVTIQFKPIYVVFDKDGGTGGSDGVMASYGQPMPSAEKPEKTGYAFTGYFRNVEGKEIQYYDANMNSAKNWNLSENEATLTAKWENREYNVKLNYDDDNDPVELEVTFGEPMPPAPMPTKTGKIFMGYFTEPDGKGVQYYDENMQSVRYWDIDEDNVNLYAYMVLKEYTITFHEENGTDDIDFIEGIHYGDVFPSAVAPKNAGRLFMGYYTRTEDGRGDMYYTENMVATHATYNIDQDLELFAEWSEPLEYHIIYELDGGINNPNNPEVFTVVDHVVLYEATNEPLIFAGWLYNGNIITDLDGIIEGLDENENTITLTANWSDTIKIRIGQNFENLRLTTPNVIIYMTQRPNFVSTLSIASTTKSVLIYGYNNPYYMNITVDSDSEGLTLKLKDITITSNSSQPTISLSDSTLFNLYTYGSVYIKGATKSDGSGGAAISCGYLRIFAADDLHIIGGNGSNGGQLNNNGTNGGNAGPAVISDLGVYIVCNNVTIQAGTAGRGGDAASSSYYKGYGGNGSQPIVGINNAPVIYKAEGVTNVNLIASSKGADGAGKDINGIPLNPVDYVKPGTIITIGPGITIPTPPIVSPGIK